MKKLNIDDLKEGYLVVFNDNLHTSALDYSVYGNLSTMVTKDTFGKIVRIFEKEFRVKENSIVVKSVSAGTHNVLLGSGGGGGGGSTLGGQAGAQKFNQGAAGGATITDHTQFDPDWFSSFEPKYTNNIKTYSSSGKSITLENSHYSVATILLENGIKFEMAVHQLLTIIDKVLPDTPGTKILHGNKV